MTNREALIQNINVGDIFHAEGANGASLVCLAVAINDTSIRARRLFAAENLEFDRTTGLLRSVRSQCPIDSIAPLPPDIRHVLENLDYRHNYGPKPADTKLTRAEKDALSFIDDYYRANPI